MIGEFGIFCLILALLFSIALVIIPLAGLRQNNQTLISSANFYVYGQAFFILCAYLFLSLAFLLDDFSLLYVLNNSSKKLPQYYKLCALWGGHEGSMLLWVLVLSIWTLLISIASGKLDSDIRVRIQIVLGFIVFSFILFILTSSNPFIRQFAIVDTMGKDLNPLLQDPGFLFHPPTLYIGYVGLALPFAFAIASLWLGEFSKEAAKVIRPFILIAWCFLTIGITLGSWWAYRELGWGGWWFWDPVENASFMPWLVSTALIHSFIASEKRGQFIGWTLLLAIIGFGLSLLGTFLVRSGVLTSVHSFAADPLRGLYILGLFVILFGMALLLFAFRAEKVNKNVKVKPLSRENALLFNSIIFFVLMLSVLLGTIYPLIIDSLGLGKLSVGAPYFNSIIVPLLLPVLIIMGAGIHMKWQKNSFNELRHVLLLPLVLVAGMGIILLFLLSWKNIQVILGILVAVWIICSSFYAVFLRHRNQHKISGSFLGMTLAHVGIAVTVLGITVSNGFGVEKDIQLSPNQTVNFANYNIKFLNESEVRGSNYHGTKGHFQIIKDNSVKNIYPEKRIYDVGQMVMTESAIDVTPFRDIYVALGDPIGAESWTVRLYYKPLVRFIWAGGFLMLFGALFSIYDRRFRTAK